MPKDTDTRSKSHQLMPFFSYDHLPKKSQAVAKDFHDLAQKIINRGGDLRQTTMAMQKLLEAKDCAVKAALPTE